MRQDIIKNFILIFILLDIVLYKFEAIERIIVFFRLIVDSVFDFNF